MDEAETRNAAVTARTLDAAAAADAPAAAKRARSARRLPDIDPQRCTGCGRCVAACAPHLLSLEVVRWRKSSVLHEPERCTGCSLCALRCPFDAITMRKPAADPAGTVALSLATAAASSRT